MEATVTNENIETTQEAQAEGQAPAKRTMTLARLQTRMKTIVAQLKRIESDVQNYGAWCNKTKLPIGEQRVALDKNQNQAIEYIKSAYQQYNALIDELVTLKRVLNKANNETFIEVGGKSLSISDALFYQKEIADRMKAIVRAHEFSVTRAESAVAMYNNQLSKIPEGDLDKVIADVLYLVPRSEIEAKSSFLNEFLAEVNSLINEANNATIVTVE